MCPACISTATLALVGAISTGGLAALLATIFGRRRHLIGPPTDSAAATHAAEEKAS